MLWLHFKHNSELRMHLTCAESECVILVPVSCEFETDVTSRSGGAPEIPASKDVEGTETLGRFDDDVTPPGEFIAAMATIVARKYSFVEPPLSETLFGETVG